MAETLREKINKWGFLWGMVYGLVSLGFYFTPWMLFVLGLASFSTALAFQDLLFAEYRWRFVILGLLFAFITILIYLKRQGVTKVSMADITQHRLFVGTLVLTFAMTYLVIFWLVTFLFPPSS